ncbi:MAG TPA: hypothetical protein VG013_02715 [Gemmataceae bacterium]|nr:hypothetical protein [Gemmataceae bacterium]
MLFWFLCYLAAHVLAYVLVVRHLAWFRRESAILLYHAVPAVLVAVWALASCFAAPGNDSVYRAALLWSGQGIYSLSFLELWALAQGGYSLHILSRFASAGGTVSAADLTSLQHLGAGKRADRLAGLVRMRLIRPEGDGFQLTGRGRVVAGLLGCVARLVNLKQLG